MWKGNLALSGIPSCDKRKPNRFYWNETDKILEEHLKKEEQARKAMPKDFGWNYGKPEE
jgi:hypothetical protein